MDAAYFSSTFESLVKQPAGNSVIAVAFDTVPFSNQLKLLKPVIGNRIKSNISQGDEVSYQDTIRYHVSCWTICSMHADSIIIMLTMNTISHSVDGEVSSSFFIRLPASTCKN